MNKSKFLQYLFILNYFIFIWLCYGVLVSKQNISGYYGLHRGASVVGGSGTFSVGNPGGDTFLYKGQYFANKQPGQFAIGGVVYSCLRLFGYNYDSNYVETGAWVTFLASSIFGAGCVTLVLIICWKLMRLSLESSMLGSLFFAFGTTYGSYSTILHHDVIAGFMVMLSVYLAFSISEKNDERFKVFSSIFFSSLTLSVSMLYSWSLTLNLIRLLVVYWRQVVVIILALALGLASWLMYNYAYFDDPFVTAMQASKDPVIFAPWGLTHIVNYVPQFFLIGELSILKYTPIIYIGLIGLVFSKAPVARMLLFMGIMHSLILMIMPFAYWHQQCQYGPRYLMPFMVYMACGIAVVFDYLIRGRRWVFLSLVVAVGLFSILVNITGALFGTMYCGPEYAFYKYFSVGVISVGNLDLPLFNFLVIPLFLSALLLFYSYQRQKRLGLLSF